MYFENEIDKYVVNLSSEEDDILKELNRETHLKVVHARMISGHPQGKLLEIISKMLNPLNILEIGTFTGYSALCLARGLKPMGMVHTIDINDELQGISEKFFKKAGMQDKIKMHIGDALKIIPEMNISFDLIFIDADKLQYTQYYDLVIDKVISGGVILVDNVLWNKKVIDQKSYNEPETRSIMDFNKKVKNDTRVEVIILPLRDGISLIRKH
jgi:predicted O-methyltransferase YrrM